MIARLAAVVLGFAACGAASSFIFDGNSVLRGWFLFPLPFALLARLLCLRGNAVVFGVGSIAAWNAAYWSTMFLYTDARAALALLVGGVLGGLALTAAAGFESRKLWSPKMLGAGTLVGGVMGLEFLLHLHDDRTFVIPFALWQAAMGTFLYIAGGRRADTPKAV